jgi:hypothetical protein
MSMIFFRETNGKMLAVIIVVMLASVGSGRNIPYVPEVLHPPVPEEGKYEEKKGSYFRKRHICSFFLTVLKSDLQGINFIHSRTLKQMSRVSEIRKCYCGSIRHAFSPSLMICMLLVLKTVTNQNLIQEEN